MKIENVDSVLAGNSHIVRIVTDTGIEGIKRVFYTKKFRFRHTHCRKFRKCSRSTKCVK